MDGTTDVVGRNAELLALEDLLAAAAKGRGGTVLVHGEPGIGKSTLARAYAERAAGAQRTVCWGRAWEAGGAPPYWPWIEVLREAVAVAPNDALKAAPALGVLAELLPEIAERIGPIAASPPLDGTRARFRLFDAVLRFLRCISASQPLALVLDDLHAADVPTLQLLAFVVAGLPKTNVALVGTYRDVEARLSPESSDLLLRARRDAERCLGLSRLGPREVAELVVAHTGHEATSNLIEQLFHATEGNPLFIVETLRLMDAAETSLESGAVPHGVQGVLRHRLALLPDETRALLETGAAMGRDVDIPVLCLATGLPLEVVLSRLRPAETFDVLVPRGEDRWTFTHVLLRDALYGALPTARRAAIHLTIGEALERRHSADARTRTMGLAHHYLEAAPAAGIERALVFAERAAESALSLHAHEEAIALLERALSALDLAADDGSRRLDLLLVLGRTCIRGGATSRGRAACLEAARIAKERGDASGLARAALAMGQIITFARTDPVLVALLREALDAAGDAETPVRAQLLGRLAAALQPAHDPTVPMQMARDAIAQAHLVGDSATRLAVLTSAGSALLYFAEPSERMAVNRELVEIASVRGDRTLVARGHLRLVFDSLEQGDVASTDAHIAAYEQVARELALPAYLWNLSMLRAMRATLSGRFDEAARFHEEARLLAEQTDDPNAAFTLAVERYFRLVGATRWDEAAAAEATFRTALLGATDHHYRTPCVAVMLARTGRTEEARATIDELHDHLDEWKPRASVVWLAEACARVGDVRSAERLLPMCAAFAHRFHVCGLAAMTCEGPITDTMGMLCELLGRIDEAVVHYDDARARAEAMGAVPLRAKIEMRLARALRRRGAGGDGARADELIDRVRNVAVELRMPGLLDLVDELEAAASDTGARPSPRPSPNRQAHSRRGGLVPKERSKVHLEMELNGDYWCIRSGDAEVRLRDARGLRILDRLVREPGRSIHAIELLGTGDDVADGGDAGEALDATAIRAYRARVTALREAIGDAEELGQSERAEQLREEMEDIARALSSGLGLGGRARRVASGAERARINVRRRVVEAMQRIAAELPDLGAHLGRTVKTGTFCSYHPEGPPTVTDRAPPRPRK